jgi:hypothetical protein
MFNVKTLGVALVVASFGLRIARMQYRKHKHEQLMRTIDEGNKRLKQTVENFKNNFTIQIEKEA